MPEISLYLLLSLAALSSVLLLVLLFRKSTIELPADLGIRLGLIEQSLQGLAQACARTEAFSQRMDTQLREFSAATALSQDAFRKTLDDKLEKMLEESRNGRAEQHAQLQSDSAQARKALSDSLGQFRLDLTSTLDGLKKDTVAQLGVMSTAMKDQLDGNGNQIRNQFATLQDGVVQQLQGMVQGAQQNAEQLRTALNERLAAIQADNTSKLEEMRRTVDEKLHATLEQRLGDSFKLVSERLEQVHNGLGEMKSLAGSVGDLKRVMTNVRTRGTWGEVQLGAIIESLLTAEQFARNVKTVPGSNELVEFAIKMPGKGDDDIVWLPVDSKYPVEHYQRLMDAHEQADKDLITKASTAFESSLKLEARKIQEKYLNPPNTTDFAILFVPTEGLFAEVCRIPGMVEALQNQFRVVVAGPTTLAAMLNSLRLGFRTLAIEKRSSEVWNILSGVKTEFRKFGEVIEATQKSIDAASKKFGDVGTRTRAIERRLRGVEELPPGAATGLEAAGLDAADLLAIEDDAPTA